MEKDVAAEFEKVKQGAHQFREILILLEKRLDKLEKDVQELSVIVRKVR